MHADVLLQDLAVVMIVAALATLLFRKLKQPVVLGYILAGLIIGPHTPPFALIRGEETIETIAQLGIIFLMFALGLEFSFRKLQKVGAPAFIAASLEILLMVLAGYELGQFFGWSQKDSIFLGAILSISSTTIIIKALDEMGKKKEGFASLVFGILIVEDILAIIMLALLSGYATTGTFSAREIGTTIVELGAFLVILLVVGLIFVPRLLNYIARFKSDEMLVVTVVGLCFGVTLVTLKLGYSIALGAFLIGAIIAESRQIAKIEILMHPVRDILSAVFFVSIGLMIDPLVIYQYAVPILLITVVVVFGKVITCAIGCFISGNDIRNSLLVGMSVAQIGEFSFIIAQLGHERGGTSDFLYPIAVAVSALTTLLTPYLIKNSDRLAMAVDRHAPKPVTQFLDAYSKWVGGISQQGSGRIERKILQRLGAQIGLNLLLITGIFIAAIFTRRHIAGWWPQFPGGIDGIKATLWLVALMVSFPLLVAVWRKLEVGAMVISEMSAKNSKAGVRTPVVQAVITSTILVFATGALLLFLLALSSALLPSGNILVLTLLVVAGSAFLLHRGSVKLYARAQSALHETFEQTADPLPHLEASSAPAHLLKEAKLETVELHSGMKAVGKMITEIQLRSETGASVVGIEREGKSMVNPDPGEELQSGDQVLLIGTEDQINRAKALLTLRTEPN